MECKSNQFEAFQRLATEEAVFLTRFIIKDLKMLKKDQKCFITLIIIFFHHTSMQSYLLRHACLLGFKNPLIPSVCPYGTNCLSGSFFDNLP